ncbi:MAG: alanine--tRNA ligase [Candidatus Micrarchaeota archaeon]|nr:alanine--tRNA ligase [Candidatus Micrarchaeota archaeon]MDE1847826.1 alanine--tRNA ligase [Candidatus Micrarchaeota archaeon]MDE1864368.1 alanine--tRNA ligase [Candidatus Micrarchaeota archaeon]
MIPKVEKLDKDSLRAEFGKSYKEYYWVELFGKEGFERYKCLKCGKNFWSTKKRDACGEHEAYSFFKAKPVKISYVEFWKKYAEFFRKNGHTEVPRYPVVSRWRQDLYFTIASIQDFQRIENGNMGFEYAANPLVVPQICLRFSDIENVGVTGKHFTGFMMAGQHSFDYPNNGYWREKCIELNYKFLTEVLGVKKGDLVYHEDVWAMGDFSEFGPCLESFANGIELVNSVFTQFECVNGKISELKGRVVDVGWGFDRLLWFYTGYDNAYRAVFSGEIEKFGKRLNLDFDDPLFRKFAAVSGELDITEAKEAKSRLVQILKEEGIKLDDYEKRLKPLHAFYAILDHTRSLLFAISDGALPSNIGGGYNLRIILRRALGFIEKYRFDVSITEIARLEAQSLLPLYPELSRSLDTLEKVVAIEKERYERSKQNSSKIIEGMLSKNKKFGPKELRLLYESYGVTPELLIEVAAQRGMHLEMPQNWYESILEGDFAKKVKATKIGIELPKLAKTEQLYYDYALKADAKVLFASKNYVALDKTPFYPEGGGQLADHGTIAEAKVIDAQKIGDIVVHVMEKDVGHDKKFAAGSMVKAIVDEDRRNRLMIHHTATHLMNASSREVLGKHIWQEGTLKDYAKARIDLTHYDKLSNDEVLRIERVANGHIADGIKVDVEWLDRGDAESRFGFVIYQGHGVPAKKMRIVTIADKGGKVFDAQACGGLHLVGRESRIGMVGIIDTLRIHDGVDRVEFVAGPAALDYFDKENAELGAIAQEMNVERMKSFGAVKASREAYAEMFKKLNLANEAIANIFAEQFSAKDSVEMELGKAPKEMMRKIASSIVDKNKKAVVLLANSSGEVFCACGEASGKSAIEYAKEKLGKKGFVGGGSKKAAEGKIAK